MSNPATWNLNIDITLTDGADPEEVLYRIERTLADMPEVTETFSQDWNEVGE